MDASVDRNISANDGLQYTDLWMEHNVTLICEMHYMG